MIVEAKEIEFRINRKTIIQPLNLCMEKGNIYLITGSSGSGKTTLAKIIGGELKPSGGKLDFADNLKIEMVQQQDHFVFDSGLRTTYYGQRYENPNEEGIPTVEEHLKKKACNFNFYESNGISKALKIEELLHRKLLSLSNGERRRIQLAIALFKKPDLLILDQPFVGLDAHAREILNHLLVEQKKIGTAIVIVSDPKHIPDFADKVIELIGGQISRMVSVKEYFPIVDLFNDEVDIVDYDIFRTLKTQRDNYEFIVRMKDVNVSYQGKKVLNNINWEVKSGEKWVLKGPNGAGKTTLLNLINADNPQGYTNDLVLFDRKRGSGESIWDIKKRIGFVSPELHLYFLRQKSMYHPAAGTQMNYNSMLCIDVVLSGLNDEIGFNTSYSDYNLKLAKQWLNLLSLEHLEKSPFLYSSLGEQRIILLVRALIKFPDLLILDEPCQGLDPTQTERFLKLLDLICKIGNTTMIYVTHRNEEIPAVVTHQMELKKGVVISNGLIRKN